MSMVACAFPGNPCRPAFDFDNSTPRKRLCIRQRYRLLTKVSKQGKSLRKLHLSSGGYEWNFACEGILHDEFVVDEVSRRQR